MPILPINASTKSRTATFAGGCFWCMEHPFEKLNGVLNVKSGYTGGTKEHPAYDEVSSGKTGHMEAVQISYDPAKITYEYLLDVFWKQVNPTDAHGQFTDRGEQYRTAIFYHDEEQKIQADKSKKSLEQSGRFEKPIVTEIMPASSFYTAEDYHQDYYKKSPVRYKQYRDHSGRDQFIKTIWGGRPMNNSNNTADSIRYNKLSKKELQKLLTPLQFKITQEDGTERPFQNDFWDNNEEGIYVDIVSGEALFSSQDKFESHTGWPSFTKPLEPDNIIEKVDRGLFLQRTEVRSRQADSHLGHVFPDGPEPAGLRYCINSAALRFIPRDDLQKEGYPAYHNLFLK